eukprot:6175097-Pleurochrysis_carterae.AAC.1
MTLKLFTRHTRVNSATAALRRKGGVAEWLFGSTTKVSTRKAVRTETAPAAKKATRHPSTSRGEYLAKLIAVSEPNIPPVLFEQNKIPNARPRSRGLKRSAAIDQINGMVIPRAAPLRVRAAKSHEAEGERPTATVAIPQVKHPIPTPRTRPTCEANALLPSAAIAWARPRQRVTEPSAAGPRPNSAQSS